MGMGSKKKGKGGVISEINVTPLVDVMLVLLVIFMITAPLMYNGITLNLPKTKKTKMAKLTNEQVILSITKKNEFFLGDQPIQSKNLLKKIKKRLRNTKNKVVYIRADHKLDYGKVAWAMSVLKRGGVHQLALVTEQVK